jgi:hypothetical protein
LAYIYFILFLGGVVIPEESTTDTARDDKVNTVVAEARQLFVNDDALNGESEDEEENGNYI